jgi:hypothetical protein
LVLAIHAARITFKKLRRGKLKIVIKHGAYLCPHFKIDYLLSPANAIGNLYGEDGFTNIGIGKHNAQFMLEPKAAE